MKKYLSIILLLLFIVNFSLPAFADAAPMSAADRVKNMAGEEAAWRYISAGAKIVAGGLLLAGGIGLYNAGQSSFFAAIALIPLSFMVGIPGALTIGWGTVDLLFGSREYENQFDKLSLLSEPDKENSALSYLKTRSESDHQSRQPSFWNGFGIFSMFETPAEREYKAYLKDRSQFGVQP
ncbi:MAG TPA: hypothetical protein VMD02_04535 [Candidatus Omnitrophota bacterium]|nr:hypothetical protein [Candidatus Omnitrophota bacterium]